MQARTKLTGGAAIVRVLEKAGVKYAFGMAGFQIFPYYDALYQNPHVTHVVVHDERSGAFMADAYARASGRLAVCDGTVGPGVTNLVTGLAESYHASIPVLALAADVRTEFVGRNPNQENDQVPMLKPVTKKVFRVDSPARVPELTRRAIQEAVSGRPGPVVLDVPEDVCHAEYEYPAEVWDFELTAAAPCWRTVPDPEAVQAAANLLVNARKPLIIAGGGVWMSRAVPQLQEVAERLQVPVGTTLSAKGALPETHPLSAGVIGRFSRLPREFFQDVDVIFVIGSRLGEQVTDRWQLLPSSATLIQLDSAAEELGKNYPVDVALWGDARLGLAALLQALDDFPSQKLAEVHEHRQRTVVAEVRQHVADWRRKQAPYWEYASGQLPGYGQTLHAIQDALPAEGVLVCDASLVAHWASVYYDVRSNNGRCFIANRGQAGLGYGIPAAIGSWLAQPDRPHVCLAGDGGFGFSMADLEVAVRLQAPIVFVVANNNGLGYVKALQHNIYGPRYVSSDYANIDFCAVARGFGVAGARVDRQEALKPALVEALRLAQETRSPYLVEVMLNPDPAVMMPGADTRVKVE